MALYTSSSGAGAVTPDGFGVLVEKPVSELSVAFQVGTRVSTSATTYRVPILASDVVLGPVAEGADITPSDVVFSELAVDPVKFAGLSIVSREMADDSSPSALDVVGRSIARQIAKSVDSALLKPKTGLNPQGLNGLSGISAVDAGAAFANLDSFYEALSASESAGGNISAWVTDAATALAISQLKEGTGSNRGLLNADLTVDGRRQILGRPVYVSEQAPADTVFGVSGADLQIVVRDGTRVDVDRSRYFESDRIGVRGTMRVAFAAPVPATHAVITLSE
ncbi:phage major capsid protein [Streptomyces ovatisporus]|uniref:Phage major capsid protein n=1 Tax=Streptomyces ovatisporus TaxID=1128682 RepID=A0ABV9A7L6_9ACTN